MNFKNTSNTELILHFERCVHNERKITAQVLQYIAEIDRRKLFIEKGYTSLFDYLTKDAGYSPGAAMRRIDAARLLREIPEVIDKLASGSITLSQANQVQKASRDLKKMKRTHLSTEDKRELFLQIEHSNQKDTEKIIAQTLDLPVLTIEKETLHRNQSVTLNITFTKEQMEILETAQNMISHTGASCNWAETITHLAQKELKRRTLVNQQSVPSKQTKQQNRYIPQALRKRLISPSAKCAYKDHQGRQCENQRFLQIDHVQSWSRGGSSRIENLQVLCGVHNRLKYKLGG